jgi:hypothetical protein
MKIGGIDPTTLPTEVFLVLPRGETEIVFRAQAVASYDEFDALCPRPKAPGRMTREGFVVNDKDVTYQDLLNKWAGQRAGYMMVKSLEPSNIEWDTVKESDPRSWTNWSTDLRNSGLSDMECYRVQKLVLEANCLDEDKLKKAREVFLRGQESKPDASGLLTEPANTPSGVPASA